jgi:hypothetical protein
VQRFTTVHTTALAVLFTMLICAPVLAQDDNPGSNGNTLEGVWQTTAVLLGPCEAPTPPRELPVIITFTRDGKVIETPGTPLVGPVPVVRMSPGLGAWQRLGGQQYSAVFRFFRISVPTNMFEGVQEITEDITLSDHGDEFTATGTSQVFNPNPNPIACNTLTGTRLE